MGGSSIDRPESRYKVPPSPWPRAGGRRSTFAPGARQGSGMWRGDGQPRRPVGPDRPGPCGSTDRTAVDGGRRRVGPAQRAISGLLAADDPAIRVGLLAPAIRPHRRPTAREPAAAAASATPSPPRHAQGHGWRRWPASAPESAPLARPPRDRPEHDPKRVVYVTLCTGLGWYRQDEKDSPLFCKGRCRVVFDLVQTCACHDGMARGRGRHGGRAAAAHRIGRRDVHAVAVPARCGLKQTPSRSMAQAILSRRSATERRERACP